MMNRKTSLTTLSRAGDMMKKMLLLLLMVPMLAWAGEEGPHLDAAPVNLQDHYSLQRGARTFVNYCLSCHAASAMRYSRLTDLGLTEQQIKDHLLLAGGKVGDTMTVAMDPAMAKKWFGAAPPDLSVEARARGADWLYTYLRGFYKDESRPTGWNNIVFDKVAMPHVLWELQGTQVLKNETVTDAEGNKHETQHLVLIEPGKMTPAEYDQFVGDLVNYMVYMAEPAKLVRIKIGVLVLLFLGLMFVVTYALKKEYWKDVN